MEILSSFTSAEIVYFLICIIFALFFGIMGIFKSLGFSVKIIGSITIPFLTYKKAISYLGSIFDSNDFLSNLILNSPIISEIVTFIIIFLVSYILLGILENILNISIPKNLIFKLINFIAGTIYGIFIFSILFYFAYNLTLRNFIDAEINKIMLLNINIYENIRTEDQMNSDNNENILIKENDEIY